jgi:RNA-directed DNA polymerase
MIFVHRLWRIVTGLKINELLNVDRRYVRNIRAALHSIETLGVKDAEKIFHGKHGGRSSLAAHLLGKISFLTHIKGQSDPVVRSITLRFNRYFPTRPIKVTPTRSEIRDRSVWVVDHSEYNGTAFFLKEVGRVTAHTVSKASMKWKCSTLRSMQIGSEQPFASAIRTGTWPSSITRFRLLSILNLIPCPT